MRPELASDRLGASDQKGEKKHPRIANYNVHRCDSPGDESQRYRFIPKQTPNRIERCDALGGDD